MIKVNLLRDQTARVRKTYATSKVSWIGLMCGALFLLVAGSMALWTYSIRKDITASTKKLVDLKKEEARLKEQQKKFTALNKLKQQRQERINAIEQLQEAKRGPVLLLNAVIRSIPRNGDLYITSLTKKAKSVKLIGYTPQPRIIPNLMNNLAASGIFSSVDLEIIERKDDVSRFSLICTSNQESPAE